MEQPPPHTTTTPRQPVLIFSSNTSRKARICDTRSFACWDHRWCFCAEWSTRGINWFASQALLPGLVLDPGPWAFPNSEAGPSAFWLAAAICWCSRSSKGPGDPDACHVFSVKHLLSVTSAWQKTGSDCILFAGTGSLVSLDTTFKSVRPMHLSLFSLIMWIQCLQTVMMSLLFSWWWIVLW